MSNKNKQTGAKRERNEENSSSISSKRARLTSNDKNAAVEVDYVDDEKTPEQLFAKIKYLLNIKKKSKKSHRDQRVTVTEENADQIFDKIRKFIMMTNFQDLAKGLLSYSIADIQELLSELLYQLSMMKTDVSGKMLTIVNFMRDHKQLQLETKHYNWYIRQLVTRMKVEQSIGQLEIMEKNYGLKPDSFTYRNLIFGFISIYKVRPALRVLSMLLEDYIQRKAAEQDTLKEKEPEQLPEIKENEDVEKLLEDDRQPEQLKDGHKPANEIGLMYHLAIAIFNAALKQSNIPNALEALSMLESCPDFTIPINPYNTLLAKYVNMGKYEDAAALFSRLTNHGVAASPDKVTYSIMIRGFITQNKVDVAEQLFEKMRASGVKPDVILLNFLIKGYADLAQTERIEETIELMQQLELQPNPATYAFYIDCLVRQSRLEEAEQLFAKMSENLTPTIDVVNSMMNGYVQENRFDKAKEFLEEMKTQHGVEANNTTFKLLSIQYESDKSLSKGDVFLFLKKLVNPRNTAYTLEPYSLVTIVEMLLSNPTNSKLLTEGIILELTRHLKNNKNYQKIAGLIDLCTKVKFPIKNKDILYHNLIDAACKASNVEYALQVIEDVKDSVTLKAETYGSLISSLASQHSLEKALQIIETLKSNQLNEKTFLSLIKDYSAKKRFDEVSALVDKMKLSGVQMSAMTFDAINQFHAVSGDLKAAEKVFQDMLSLQIKPSALSYGLVLYSFYKRQSSFSQEVKAETEEAFVTTIEELLERMAHDGYATDIASVNAILTQFLIVGISIISVMEMLECLCELLKVKPSATTFTILLRNHAHFSTSSRAIAECEEIINKVMPKHNVKPSVFHFEFLIMSYVREGMIAKAETLLVNMTKKYGLQPNGTILMYMKEGYIRKASLSIAQSGEIEKALSSVQSIFAKMKEKNIAPSVIAYAACIQTYLSKGMLEQAEAFMKMMLQSGYRISTIQFMPFFQFILDKLQTFTTKALVEQIQSFLEKITEYCPDDSLVDAFNLIIEKLTLLKRADLVHEVMKLMPKFSVRPNARTFEAILLSPALSLSSNTLESYVKKMHSVSNITPSLNLVTAVVNSYDKEDGDSHKKKVKDFVNEAKKMGLNVQVKL